MGTMNQILQSLVYDYTNTYPGFFKKQRLGRGLGLPFDFEYADRMSQLVERKYDLDNINL
jgi:hypothetical protein